MTVEADSTINQDLKSDADVTFGSLSVANSGIKISDGSHNLILKTASDLDTSDKTITFTTGNSDRGITLGGDISTAGDFTTQNNNSN